MAGLKSFRLRKPQNPIKSAFFHSGYRGAYIIEREVDFALIQLTELVEKYKKEYPDFAFYKVVVNKIPLEDYRKNLIEVTKNFKIHIIKDNIREHTLTIIIEQ